MTGSETRSYSEKEFRQLVKSAYEEGYVDGAGDGWVNNPRIEKDWKGSRAFAALKTRGAKS